MSDFSTLQSSLQDRIKTRSMGVKLIIVCGLALLMTIPALFVGGIVSDRTERAADVVKEISGHVGGQQTPGGHSADHLLSAALVSCRKNRFRFRLHARGIGHGNPAFRERRLGILQRGAANEGFGHLHFVVWIDLPAAASRRQCPAGRCDHQFPGGCGCHVFHTRDRLV